MVKMTCSFETLHSVAKAKYASCHQASKWVHDYVKSCNCHLVSVKHVHLVVVVWVLPHNMSENILLQPQGLEDDNWQKLQLEKVLGCPLAGT